MANKIFLILTILPVFLTIACGKSVTGNNSNLISNTNSGQRNTFATNPSTLPANSNANTPTSNSKRPENSDLSGNVATKEVPRQNTGSHPNQPTQSAPDNSEISTYIGENLIQTRTFKDHPQILKVEATTFIKENNCRVINVFLKNGTVKEIPESKIYSPINQSAENILKAIETNP